MRITEFQMNILRDELDKNMARLKEIKESNSEDYLTADKNDITTRNTHISALLNSTEVVRQYNAEQISVGTTFSIAYLNDDDYNEEVLTLIEQPVSKNDSSTFGFITVTSPLGNAVHRKKINESFAYLVGSETMMGVITKIYTKEEQKEYYKSLSTQFTKTM